MRQLLKGKHDCWIFLLSYYCLTACSGQEDAAVPGGDPSVSEWSCAHSSHWQVSSHSSSVCGQALRLYCMPKSGDAPFWKHYYSGKLFLIEFEMIMLPFGRFFIGNL
jgi:hypothetical protein